MADLDGFEERYGLNSRLVKRDGALVEEVYRVGGRYGDADRPHRRAICATRCRTRPPAMRRRARGADPLLRDAARTRIASAYDIAWVADKDSPVDTINGFIENYLDARGVKGAWEALVYFVNDEKTDGLQRLAEAAAWFEARMPWDPQWRRDGRRRRHRPRHRRRRRNRRRRAR